MIYDGFAHLPIYGLEDLGFVPRGEAGRLLPSATPLRALSIAAAVGPTSARGSA
jgi:hypothetical protein